MCGNTGHNSASCNGNGYSLIEAAGGEVAALRERQRRHEAGIYIPLEKKPGNDQDKDFKDDLSHDVL